MFFTSAFLGSLLFSVVCFVIAVFVNKQRDKTTFKVFAASLGFGMLLSIISAFGAFVEIFYRILS